MAQKGLQFIFRCFDLCLRNPRYGADWNSFASGGLIIFFLNANKEKADLPVHVIVGKGTGCFQNPVFDSIRCGLFVFDLIIFNSTPINNVMRHPADIISPHFRLLSFPFQTCKS